MSVNIPREKDFIFPGEIFDCSDCHQQNQFSVIVKARGVVVWGGALCPHEDKTRIGKKIKKFEAAHFLRTEREEAEKTLNANGKIDTEKRKNLLKYISDINAALVRMRML